MLAESILVYVLSSVVLVLSGALIGWFFANREITEHRLRVGIAIVITIVWVITIIAEIVIPSYTVAMVIHAIMGAVVGYLFSDSGLTSIIKNSKK